MKGLSPGARRLVALALLLVPVTLLIAIVAVPVLLAERSAARLADLDGHIERLEERLVTREQVLAELRQLERMSRLDTRLLAAETPTVAGAALAGSLSTFLQEEGGRLDSTQVLEPVLDPPVMRIGVRLRGAIDLAGLRGLLHRIESYEPLLTVERIALRQDAFLGGAGLVETELTVVGYGRAELANEPEEAPAGAATSG
jgi:hypothetical protein